MRPFLVSCVGVLDRDDVGNDGDINKDSQMNRGKFVGQSRDKNVCVIS